MPDRLANEAVPAPVTAAQVHEEFERLLKDRTHLGVCNFLGDVVLEPRNPFERSRRRPKKPVVIIGCLALLCLAIVYAFHLR